jgi:hypothetical protein
MGQTLDNLSLRGVINRLAREPVLGLDARAVLIAGYLIVGAAISALLIAFARRDNLVAVEGAILIIGMLALSPVSSRYHFIVLMLPYAVVAAATVCQSRNRLLNVSALAASFILVTGTSNDLTGQTLAEFAHAHGFMLWGALILLVPLGVMGSRSRLQSAKSGRRRSSRRVGATAKVKSTQ